MDLELIKSFIKVKVYHIHSAKEVPSHKHTDMDEIFYCIKGEGFGVLEAGEQELSVGKVFIVPAGTRHSLRSDSDLYVCSILVPKVN